jgi:hypothetical protein
MLLFLARHREYQGAYLPDQHVAGGGYPPAFSRNRMP